MRHLRHVGLVILALIVATSTASAQRARSTTVGTWELGLDGLLQLELGVPTGAAKSTSLQVPITGVRAGYTVNDAWSLEPSLVYQYVKTEGTPAVSAYGLGFAGLYHFTKNRNTRQMYLRPFFQLLGFSGGGGANVSDQLLGVGVGYKWPRLNGRMAWRGEAGLSRQMDAEITALNILWGLSFFTR
jgi:hypothetical protein